MPDDPNSNAATAERLTVNKMLEILRGTPDNAVSQKILATSLLVIAKELRDELDKRDMRTRELFHETLLKTHKEIDENWNRKYQGQLALVEALKNERDMLRDILNERWTRRRPEMKLVNSDE